MFRKLLLTGILGLGTFAGVIATPATAEAGYCRPARVVYHRGYRHWAGYRYVAPAPVIVRPTIVAPPVCAPAPVIVTPACG
jgi:hypothetical protein